MEETFADDECTLVPSLVCNTHVVTIEQGKKQLLQLLLGAELAAVTALLLMQLWARWGRRA